MPSTWGAWLAKYFWEGQNLDDNADAQRDASAPFIGPPNPGEALPARKDPAAPGDGFRSGGGLAARHRRLVGMAVPAVFFHIVWWSFMITRDQFHLFADTVGVHSIPRWYMTVTMLVGSMVAGATSEGGGAVAFPMMTLAFGILPCVARDFSFMIQSVGMTSAAFAILFMRIRVEVRALVYCTLGGVAGIIFGLEKVAPSLPPAYSKMYFVCIWFGFAFCLFWLNRNYHRRVFEEIPDFEAFSKFGISWRAVVLLASGFIGGVFSSISGAGIDFCCFSILTLLFRVSEKIATPTSVILIAINTCVGFLYQNFFNGGMHEQAWGFFAVCVPVAVIGAPFGSCVGSHFHRLVLASMVYVVDVTQFILALFVVKPWLSTSKGGATDTPTHLTVSSLLLLVSGAMFFKLLEMMGRRLLDLQEKKMIRQDAEAAANSASDVWLKVPEFDPATRDVI